VEPSGIALLVGAAAVVAGSIWHAARWMSAGKMCGRIGALIAASRFDEAYELLYRIDGSRLPAAHRAFVAEQLGFTTWLRGEHETALAWYGRAVAEGQGEVAWWSRYQRAHLLVILGRDDERAALQSELDLAPAGVVRSVMKQELKLAQAFYGDRTDDLPGALTLVGWAEVAVARRSGGDELVYLAWAFWRRGDDELARRYGLEAAATMRIPLHRSQPKLHAWLEERCTEWSMSE
jgi:hypothetical protein